MRTLVTVNMKGGVGKTTTVHNLASVFSIIRKKKLRVLVLDMDPQANYSMSMGMNYPDMMRGDKLDWGNLANQPSLIDIYDDLAGDDTPTMAHILFEKINEMLGSPTGAYADVLSNAIVEHTPEYHYIPGHPIMTYYDLVFEALGKNESGVFVDDVVRISVLQSIIEDIASLERSYDLLLIDTNPSLGYLTSNSIKAATDLLIPVSAENYPMLGMVLAHAGIVGIAKKGGDFRSINILITMLVANTNTGKNSTGGIKSISPKEVMKTMIPRRVAAQDAILLGKPVVETDPKNDAAVAYVKAAQELWQRIRKS